MQPCYVSVSAFPQSSEVTVSLSAGFVAEFNGRWPCSPIPARGCWFSFSRRNGDLVDMSPHLSKHDGDALLALSASAQRYANVQPFA